MQTDYTISGSGSLYLFASNNDKAAQWLSDHVGSEAQWLGNSLAVEWRYVDDLAENLINDGFTVDRI